jgi:hypothetical protein
MYGAWENKTAKTFETLIKTGKEAIKIVKRVRLRKKW